MDTRRGRGSLGLLAVAGFCIAALFLSAVSPAAADFTDVPNDHPFHDDITWLVDQHIAAGYPDGTFRPTRTVTRQSIAAFLYRLSGSPAYTPPPTPTFTDVGTTHPFFKEIEWLASTGITTGYPDGRFKPGEDIKRQSLAAFLYRYAESPAFTPPASPSFTDVNLTHPFRTEIEWLADTGITTGYPNGTFQPRKVVTRQAIAAFLHNYNEWSTPTTSTSSSSTSTSSTSTSSSSTSSTSTSSSTTTTSSTLPGPDVIEHCGTLTADATWGPGVVHLVTCPVVIGQDVTLTVEPGAVVKLTSVLGALTPEPGGSVEFAGTEAEPVTVTVASDDTIGGDSNGDGDATSPTQFNGWELLIKMAGGSVTLDHTDVHWITYGFEHPSVILDHPEDVDITIRNSTFTYPQTRIGTGGWAGFDIANGGISTGPCGTGEISNNTFDGYALSLANCPLTMTANTFLNTPHPLDITNHSDLTLIDLAGADTNTFEGTGPDRVAYINGTVPDGKSWTIDDSPSNAVIEPGSIAVYGALHVAPGTTMKLPGWYAFIPQPGGLVEFAGTEAEPVTVTVASDDTIGGDSNGDSDATSPTQFNGWEILIKMAGGSVTLDHTDVRWVTYGIEWPSVTTDPAPVDVTITNSTFSMPETRIGTGGWVGFDIEHGGLAIADCGTGDITNNTFDGYAISLNQCPLALQHNLFRNTPHPLNINNHSDLSLIDLAGADTNTFEGTGPARVAHIYNSAVPTGRSWTIDGSPSNAVIEPGSIAVYGAVDVAPGTTIKLTSWYGFLPEPGGLVEFAGTEAEPVTVTVASDDTIGGDSNGDGDATSPTQFNGWELLIKMAGGSVALDHTDVHWITHGFEQPSVILDHPEDVDITIRNSTFTYPQTRIGTGGWIGFDIANGGISTGPCGTGEISNNTFDGYGLSITNCPLAMTANTFRNTPQPLNISGHNDLSLIDLAGPDTNTLEGTGPELSISLAGTIADGTTLTYSGLNTGAVLVASSIASSHGLAVDNGDVLLLPGSIVKGSDALFDLGRHSDFQVVGTAADPVVFTSIDDDAIGGDTNGDGPPVTPHRLPNIFKDNQTSAAWEFIGGAAGVDLDRIGPGSISVDNAVVRHTDDAFASCIVCSAVVHNTDFIDVGTGVSQAYYFLPVAPCLPLMGPEALDGGNPIWNPANATNNYWGGSWGPSLQLDLAEIALAWADAHDLAVALKAGLPLGDLDKVDEALGNLVTHYGSDVFSLQTGTNASIDITVQTCFIPVINVGFPVIFAPVQFDNFTGSAIHPEAEATLGPGGGGW